MTKYTVKDAANDLAFIVELTNIFDIDEKGFWVMKDSEERFKYDLDKTGEGLEIVNFQDPLPKGNYHLFNPFAEGFGKHSPAVQFFYRTVRVVFNTYLKDVILHAARELLLSKEDKDKRLSPSILRITSVPVDKKSSLFDVIDEKMIDEFEKIVNRVGDELVFVAYLKNQMTSRIKVDALTDKQWDDKYTEGVRKKSIQAFKSLIMGVLGIKSPEDVEEFTVKYDPDLKSAARFHTTLSVYLKLYSRFNDAIEETYVAGGTPAGQSGIDLGQLSDVIERLPLAYAIAKHMIQPTLPKNQVNDTTTSDTSKLTMAGGHRKFHGPEIIDDFGRRTRGQQTLNFGQPEKRRFASNIISDAPMDPFAPATRMNPTPVSGFGNTNQFGGGGFSSGSFGGQGGYFGNQGSNFGTMNSSLPSNFGRPETRRSYF